jgi:hypothetical protein
MFNRLISWSLDNRLIVIAATLALFVIGGYVTRIRRIVNDPCGRAWPPGWRRTCWRQRDSRRFERVIPKLLRDFKASVAAERLSEIPDSLKGIAQGFQRARPHRNSDEVPGNC